MNKKQKAAKKKLIEKNTLYLITDMKNERSTTITPFDDVSELEEYLVDELENDCDYQFNNGNDIVIRGEQLTVKVQEKTFKVNIK